MGQSQSQSKSRSQSQSQLESPSQEQLYAREVRELLAWCERFNNGGVENFE
ncbi:hypothetical protein KR059_007645 [Drosophila kikkawai]|nr:hypothetical protein KR059_007645 [Drosophila kikkawai]